MRKQLQHRLRRRTRSASTLIFGRSSARSNRRDAGREANCTLTPSSAFGLLRQQAADRSGGDAREPRCRRWILDAEEAREVSFRADAPSGRRKSLPPDRRDCYRASAPPVLAAAAEIFLGAWQHGVVGEYPVNVYL